MMEQETTSTREGIIISSAMNVVLPDEIMVTILSYLDVRTLVEIIKPVSYQWQILSTTIINSKGIETKQRKVFETNDELRTVVARYCPLPKGGIHETMKQQYCNRDVAEEIACTYGWPINQWDVSQIEDFSNVFYGGEKNKFQPVDGIQLFNETISHWNVSNAITMDGMFWNASQFNQTISNWDVSNVIDMEDMFRHAINFNQDISTWDVSNVQTMEYMFENAIQFNQNISIWNVSNVTTMEKMFYNAKQFNQNLSSWDISNVTDMEMMFYGAEQFHQDISTWGEVWDNDNDMISQTPNIVN